MEQHKTILVIDDDAQLLTALVARLSVEGYSVETASDGVRGLARLGEHLPDLIILDVNMPGMGGIKFLRAITGDDGKTRVPVIVHTARTDMEEFFACISIAGFVAKSESPDILLRMVARIIGSEKLRTIVLGDDERSYAGHLEHELQKAGFAVQVAANGPEVLKMCVARPPDLVLVKMVLAGMNGDMVAATLQSLLPGRKVPVLVYDDSGMTAPHRGGAGVTKFIATDEIRIIIDAVRATLG